MAVLRSSLVAIFATLGAMGLAGCVTVSTDPLPVTREFTIEAKETAVEIYPGKTVTMWTFNGIVPGPLIRATEGDRVIVHFYNNHTLPHTIHFHGSHAADMDGTEPVAPGGHRDYDFIAGPAGAYVYHCHVDTRIHIQRGMYGQFIVDPRHRTFPSPERELFAVFSDWNPNLNETSEAFLLNGRSFPATVPFHVETGQTARFYVSSMSMIPVAAHFHGVLLKQVWPAQQPVDVVDLFPGETKVVDYRNDEPGVWMFHDHFEQHLVNEATYPGGSVGLIQVGRSSWTDASDTGMDMGDHGGSTAGGTEVNETGATIVPMHDYKFAAAMVHVKVGDTLVWRNDDPVPHTVTSDHDPKELDSGLVSPGKTYSHTFTHAGTFTYHCEPHSAKNPSGEWQGMLGTVMVEA